MARTEPGFSLVELLLALALMALALTAFVDAILLTERAGAGRYAQTQARLRVGECLEASRWIRDADGLDAVAEGTYGLDVSSGRWELAGTSDTADGLTRQLDIEPYDADSVLLTCTVRWEDPASRSMTLTTLLAR